jgi:hypothetical protein
MTDAKLLDRVRDLREAGKSPKEIARSLGLRPAEVAPLVRQVAEERPIQPVDEAHGLVGCWVSPGWDQGLSVARHIDWPGQGGAYPETAGKVAVLVAQRQRPGKVSACGYLVDTYCLGVKNALGPYRCNDWELAGFVEEFFGAFEGDPVPAPLDLARHLVLGGVEYARSLGFEPHPDFREAAGHLGPWDGPSDITFGQQGKPFYMAGPWDDSDMILRTLQRTAGEDNFHFLVGVG